MRTDYLYTLIFVIDQNQVLMLKRLKEPWKNKYNGLGGKRKLNETPINCIVRELQEESGLVVLKSEVVDCGIVSWSYRDADLDDYDSGLHVFKVYHDLGDYQSPQETKEGVLELCRVDQLLDKSNGALASNIPYFFKEVLESNTRNRFHCIFDQYVLISVTQEVL